MNWNKAHKTIYVSWITYNTHSKQIKKVVSPIQEDTAFFNFLISQPDR